MKYVTAVLLASVLLFAACQTVTPEPVLSDLPLTERVPDTPNELLFHDVLGQVSGTQIKVFGVGLGNTEQDIRALHGDPFKETKELFGTRLLMEYTFDADVINVQYKLDHGVVSGILLTEDANQLLHGDSVLDHSLDEMYSLLGLPTRIQDLDRERRYIYNEIGYDVYRAQSTTNRVYFTTPGRDVPPAGEDKEFDDELCAQVLTPAMHDETAECIVYPNACLPDGWTAVESCE